MTEEHKFNHFVPEFIIKNFNKIPSKRHNRITIYCRKRNEVFQVKTKEIFGRDKLYWDSRKTDEATIEKKLNSKMERLFAPICKKIVETEEDSIILKEKELDEIRRFFLTSMIRTPFQGDEGGMTYEERLRAKEWKMMKLTSNPYRPDRVFKVKSEDSKENMLNHLEIILNTSFSKIMDHEDCTGELAKYTKEAELAEIGIWKAASSEEFIITDTYLTFEHDFGRRYKFLREQLLSAQDEENFAKARENYEESSQFTQNAWFVPLSPKIMIVMISPFFRRLFEGNLRKYYTEEKFSDIPYYYLWPIATRKPNEPIEIQKIDIDYVCAANGAMLNRTTEYFGFRDGEKILRSLDKYHKRTIEPNFLDSTAMKKCIREYIETTKNN